MVLDTIAENGMLYNKKIRSLGFNILNVKME